LLHVFRTQSIYSETALTTDWFTESITCT